MMPKGLHVLVIIIIIIIIYSSGLDIDVQKLYATFIVNVNSLKFPPTLITYQLPMLGRGAVQLPQKHVRYKTWNGDSMPLPTSTPPRHIQSCKQILVHVL